MSELLDLKLSKSITKDEYEKKRHTLLADKENLQKKLNKKDDWMTGSNDAIDKACDIRAKFEKKKDLEKKVLIRSIGSNFFLKDGIVSPDLLKPYLAISEVKKDPIAYIGKFELADYSYLTPQTLALARQNPTWLPLQDLFINREIEFGFTLTHIKTVLDTLNITSQAPLSCPLI